MSLEDYVAAFRNLRANPNRATGRPSPHKPCMLLAVCELAEAGGLQQNVLHYGPELLQRYHTLFEIVRTPSDHANPHFPYFHLKNDGFWHPIPKADRDVVLQTMSTARSRGDIEQNIDHIALDQELFELLEDDEARQVLRDAIVTHWFPPQIDLFRQHFNEQQPENRYERSIRSHTPADRIAEQVPTEPLRSHVFRRLVIDAYDYRCAASGSRVILPDDTAMVEAAHLIPFSESHDDDPSNGIALTPNFHWAMDRNLIAPGPDRNWHVSPLIDDRIPDNRLLLDIDGRSIFLPRDDRYAPKAEALEWRLERLLADPDS